jgi:flagellar biogenesis protein FliO
MERTGRVHNQDETMDWTQILSAVFVAAMLVFIAPKAFRMMKESPQGSSSDWTSALLPLAAVIAFVVLLIYLV